MKKRIVVLGGYGNFGRRISTRLAADPAIECVVAGRSEKRARLLAEQLGAGALTVDINSDSSLEAAVAGAFAVVNTCGPFDARDYAVASECARRGVHYVDIADTRAYVKGITKLQAKAQRSGCMIVAGAGLVPAVTGMLADALASHFDTIDEVRAYLSLGGYTRGAAAMRGLLQTVGERMRSKENGQWRQATSWSRPRTVRFPAPVGKRRLYLHDAPDLELMPERYGAGNASFYTDMQPRTLARAITLISWAKRAGWIKEPARWAPTLLRLRRLLPAAARLAHGGVGVCMRGEIGGAARTRYAYLIARDPSAPAIVCSPAIALIKKWVHTGVPASGASACVGIVSLDEIKAELSGNDIVLVLS